MAYCLYWNDYRNGTRDKKWSKCPDDTGHKKNGSRLCRMGCKYYSRFFPLEALDHLKGIINTITDKYPADEVMQQYKKSGKFFHGIVRLGLQHREEK